MFKCTLTKVNDTFGFSLQDGEDHLIGLIEENGAADQAGIKDDDQIIEVNDANVTTKRREKVYLIYSSTCGMLVQLN